MPNGVILRVPPKPYGLNGKPAATASNVSAFVAVTNTDLSIGMTRSLRQFPLFFVTASAFSGKKDWEQVFPIE